LVGERNELGDQALDRFGRKVRSDLGVVDRVIGQRERAFGDLREDGVAPGKLRCSVARWLAVTPAIVAANHS
jgi:hypothetical protein